MKQTKAELIKEIEDKCNADSISIRKGIYTVRRGYFYSSGGSAEKFAARVQAAFPNARILESGNHWTPFRGGAKLANSTHWFVKFTLEDKKEETV